MIILEKKTFPERKEKGSLSLFGLIRQYFPKGTDFGDITPEQVMRVQNILNSRPRKRLGYMTPKDKFKQLTNLDYNAANIIRLNSTINNL